MTEHDLLSLVAAAAERALVAPHVIAADPAAKQALADLRLAVENLRAWQLSSNEREQPNHVRVKYCERCTAEMFFAALEGTPVDDQRWVPLELEPLPDGKNVLPSWRWRANFDGVHPTCRIEHSAVGSIYVDHRQTCGLGTGPRYKCAPYERRWKVNVERANIGVDAATDQLLALQRRLRSAES